MKLPVKLAGLSAAAAGLRGRLPASASFLTVLLVLAPVYVWAVYLPLAGRLVEAREEGSRQRTRIEEFAELEAEFRPARTAEQAEWQRMRVEFERALPSGSEAVSLVGELSLSAREAGIADAAFKTLPEARRAAAPELGGVAVEVGFHASYRQLAALLAKLGRMQRLAEIESMELTRDDTGLAVKLVVVGYYLKGKECSQTAIS